MEDMIKVLAEGTSLEFARESKLSVMSCIYNSQDSGRSLYKVLDDHDGLHYTLKLFRIRPEQSLAAIQREVVALNRQNNAPDKLPRVRSVQIHDGNAFVVMDWIEGTPLDQVIRDTPARSMDELRQRIAFIREICKTVTLLHDKRTVHRDLKPQNVLVRDIKNAAQGVAVIDLGLTAQPRARYQEGTIGYAPPEQCGVRHLNLTTQTDVFAIGQLICYAVLGRPIALFPNAAMTNWSEKPEDIIRKDSQVPLPEQLIQCISQCLQFAPEERLANARAVAGRLDANNTYWKKSR